MRVGPFFRRQPHEFVVVARSTSRSSPATRLGRSLLVLAVLFACGATAMAQSTDDRTATFFMGRVKYGRNQGRDCASVGRNLADLMSRVTTIHVRTEKTVSLSEPALFETPFLFMNGHSDFVLSAGELKNVRTYLIHGGFLFASGCCTNPAFPKAWRREMGRLFAGESVKRLNYDHPIYRSFYRLDSVRSIDRNVNIYVEGLYFNDRLVAILCEDGLCCAFSANNSCNVGRGISPEDGKKLALNIAVYSMTH